MADIVAGEWTHMSTALAGVYIKALREGKKLTQEDVVYKYKSIMQDPPRGLKLDTKKLSEIETHGRSSNSALLVIIARLLGGSDSDLAELLANNSLDYKDAISRAQTQLSQDSMAELRQIARHAPKSRLGEIARQLEKLEGDDAKLAKLGGYLDRLIED